MSSPPLSIKTSAVFQATLKISIKSIFFFIGTIKQTKSFINSTANGCKSMSFCHLWPVLFVFSQNPNYAVYIVHPPASWSTGLFPDNWPITTLIRVFYSLILTTYPANLSLHCFRVWAKSGHSQNSSSL